MFLLMGFGTDNKLIDEVKIVCDCCGKYGKISVILHYSYFSLFFIRLFKFSKRYFFHTTCCNQALEINEDALYNFLHGDYELSNKDFVFNQSYMFTCPKCGVVDLQPGNYCKHCGTAF